MIRRRVTPALLVSLLLLCGCLLYPLLHISWWVVAAGGLACAALAVPLLRAPGAAGPGAQGQGRAGMLVLSTSIGLLLGAASLARMEGSLQSSRLPVPPASVTEFRGMLSQDSSLSRKGDTVLRLSLDEASSRRQGIGGGARGGVFVLLTGDYRFALGQVLSIQAPLSLSSGNGGERYAAFVKRADIRSLGFASFLWRTRSHIREWLHESVSMVGYPSSALLEALLIGSREDVPTELYDGFLRTGSLHILALSGLHVTVVYGICFGLLSFLRRRGLRFALATVVLLGYQVLAGFMPSLLRATVMIVIGGIAAMLDRDAEPLNLLALSCIVILLIDPWQVSSLSFQLSFLALAGILLIGPLVQRPLESFVPRFLLLPLAMSIGAQAATLPLIIGQFGVYYPSGIVAGLLLVPLTTAFLWAGLAWVPLSVIPWPFLHGVVSRLFSILYSLVDACAGIFAKFPGVALGEPARTFSTAVAAALVVILLVALPRRSMAGRAARPRGTAAKTA